LYILGDFTYRLPLAEAVRLRERIECQNVTLIRGNHDGDWEDPDVPQIWEDVRDYLEIAPGYAKGHRLVMSHYPMLSWNGKARGAIMLHGHIHSRGDRTNARNRDRERPIFRYDAGLDANEYKPVSRDQILSFFGL
ncbi:MAG: metallophosphoesterase, partial [Collinsella aerofaciens]